MIAVSVLTAPSRGRGAAPGLSEGNVLTGRVVGPTQRAKEVQRLGSAAPLDCSERQICIDCREQSRTATSGDLLPGQVCPGEALS